MGTPSGKRSAAATSMASSSAASLGPASDLGAALGASSACDAAHRPQSVSSSSCVNLEQVAKARKLLLGAEAWIGWELYDRDGDSICLDGHFTIAELEALLLLMSHRQSSQLVNL